MGAFFVLRNGADAQRRQDALARLRGHFRQCGFASPWEATTGHCHVAVYPKLNAGAPQVHAVDDANFAFATGTLIYKGRAGRDALAQIWSDNGAGRLERDQLRGAYALAICVGGRLRLRIDAPGAYKVYHDADCTTVSSAFLAVLDGRRRAAVDRQGIYEYVFQGATYGGRTLVDGIRLIDHRQTIELADEATVAAQPDAPARPAEGLSFAAHLERNVAALRHWFGEIAECFGNRIDTALSGGYDSRLILAVLRDRGVNPRIHVYGAAGDEDVQLARRIADGEGLDLIHVDKANLKPASAEAMPAIVARNLDLLDAYPVDGIFDNGTDIDTRVDRAAGEALALNGGGGEIFRNFFYLPDRTVSLSEFIWTFYSQFDPSSATDALREQDYMSALAAAVQYALGSTGKRLSRRDVEQLYPAFRCRYWTARNTSVNNRFGWALTPFIEGPTVTSAIDVPIAFKNHGRFEAALIKAFSPSLARYPSAYGHDFAGEIPLKRRLKDQLTLRRPPLLRRYSFRIKARMQPPAQDGADRSWQAAIDPSFPLMRQFFRVDRVRDRGQFLRICTLEYLFSRFPVAP
jgi:asparagine synthase (glutamine-hydrolysing)